MSSSSPSVSDIVDLEDETLQDLAVVHEVYKKLTMRKLKLFEGKYTYDTECTLFLFLGVCYMQN